MSRGLGGFGPIRELVPEWLAVVAALLTQLGDVWFLAVVLTAFYWFDTPRRGDVAVVAGVWLAGMGLYKGLKELFGLPRPDRALLEPELLPRLVQPLYESTAFATGYGFPSGHAVNATIVYLGLAHVLSYGSRRRRFVGAAAIIVTVCLTRVVLGVHYLVDVVAGVAIGATVLFVAVVLGDRVPADRPTITFGFAVALGAFFVVASDAHWDAIVLLSASLGAFAGWQVIALGRRLLALERPERARRPIVVRGGAAALAVAPLVVALGFPRVSPYPAAGVIGLAIAGFVVAPVAWYSGTLRRVWVVLLFWVVTTANGVRKRVRTWRRR